MIRAAIVVAVLGLCPAVQAQQGGGRSGGKQGQNGGGGPKVGEAAPDFELKTLADPNVTVGLSSFKDKKPVVLIFGSYT